MNLKDILTDVLNYMGEEPDDHYVGNIDSNYARLVVFANSAISDIVKAHDWSLLKKQATITVVDGTVLYDLPTDFDRLITDTSYTNDSRVSLPTKDKIFAYDNNSICYEGRLIGGQIEFRNIPPGDVTFNYVSKYAVQNNLAVNQERFTRDDDEWLLDDELLMRMIRQRYSMQAGEQDPSVAQDVTNRFKKLIFADVGARKFTAGSRESSELHPPYMVGT